MRKESKKAIFGALFDKLATGSRGEIKETKKQIEKLWNTDSKQFKHAESFIFSRMDSLDSIKDAEHRAAVISGMNLFVLALTDKYFDELVQFVLKNIQDKDGRVREATRHVASWLRIKHSKFFDYKEGKNVSDEVKRKAEIDIRIYDEFLDKIEELMRKYVPTDRPMYIGDVSASVYKSLVLLWHEMSFNTSRDFEHRDESLMDPTSDEYIPHLGNNDDDDEVDADEVAGNIWADKKDGNPVGAGKWLERMEGMSTNRFKNELERLKFNREEVGEIMATLRMYGQSAGPAILSNIIPNGKARGSIPSLSDASSLVREMQSFANHLVVKNENGPISHILVETLVTKEYMGSGKPDDLEKFVKLVCQSHESIDEFLALHKEESKKRFLSMLEFYKKISKTNEDERKFALEYEEEEKERLLEQYYGESVAHHVLDWYVQVDPVGFNRTNNPRKVAAYVLAMVNEYNAEVTDVFLRYDKKELSEFGGWKGRESFSSVGYKITRPILESVGDPELLLVDPDRMKSAKSMYEIFQRGIL